MNNIVKSTLFLIIITMLSKILGFAREIVLMYFYGTSIYSDAYIIAMNIPNVIFSAIGAAISTTFIPLYSETLENRGKEKALEFINNILNTLLIIGIVLSFFGFIFSEEIVRVFAPNFSGEKLEITINLSKIMMGTLIFIGLSNIMTSYLQINDNFLIPGIVIVPYNIIIIISIILSVLLNNIYIIGVGTVLSVLIKLIFQIPSSIKLGYKYKFEINFKDENIKKIIILVIPVFIGIAVDQINIIVDRSLASGLGDGVIASLNSANRLVWFVLGVFISAISTVIYPSLSKLSSENNKDLFNNIIIRSINIVVMIIIPITVGAIIFSKPIVRIIFERGAFDESSTNLTSVALICYSIGMIGFALREVLDRVFFSLKDTKTPMINGIISIFINIILGISLVGRYGHAGLAIATSISSLICIMLLFRSLKKSIGNYGQKHIIINFIKVMGASIFMGYVCITIYDFLGMYLRDGLLIDILHVAITIIIGSIIYGISIIMLKIEEIKYIIKLLNKKHKIIY